MKRYCASFEYEIFPHMNNVIQWIMFSGASSFKLLKPMMLMTSPARFAFRRCHQHLRLLKHMMLMTSPARFEQEMERSSSYYRSLTVDAVLFCLPSILTLLSINTPNNNSLFVFSHTSEVSSNLWGMRSSQLVPQENRSLSTDMSVPAERS